MNARRKNDETKTTTKWKDVGAEEEHNLHFMTILTRLIVSCVREGSKDFEIKVEESRVLC